MSGRRRTTSDVKPYLTRFGGIFIAALSGAFLLGCASQVEKPENLAITETDGGARCDQAWLNFENYRADVRARNPTIRVEILSGSSAQQFLAAYNLSTPPTNFVGDRVALFTVQGSTGTLVTIISRENCVQMATIYNNLAIQMWRLGRPGFSSSFPAPKIEGPKRPSI